MLIFCKEKLIYSARFLVASLSFLLVSQNLCAKVTIKSVNFDNKENIEIGISQKSTFKVYTLQSPNRVVIDIDNSDFGEVSQEKKPNFVEKVRFSKNPNYSRIVFDTNQKIIIQGATYQKLKNDKYGKIIIKITPEISNIVNNNAQKPKAVTKNTPQKLVVAKKIPVIVIDAGHGGKDPGTIGNYARTKEKNITLSYAKELVKHLVNTGKYKVYMTRNQDVFVPLKERVEKARKVKADLFISLHANAAEDLGARGFSIYTLSETASDKQAEMLARKENRSDIISGINFENASFDILKTLIDMSQRSSMNYSSRFADIAIKSVRKQEIEILHNTHRFAGFMVLTAPDMVSILIELGYLSNKSEEKQLNNLVYKRKIVKGLVDSIDEYFTFNTTSHQ